MNPSLKLQDYYFITSLTLKLHEKKLKPFMELYLKVA